MELTIHSADLIQGSFRKPTNVEVSQKGFGVGISSRIMNPWRTIQSVDIHGPSSETSRVTATRVATLGIFALAAKKSTTETLVVVTLVSGSTVSVMFRKKTDQEVRAIFSPYLSQLANSTNQDDSQLNTASLENRPESSTQQIQDLVQLLDKGLIDKNEFELLKSEILEKLKPEKYILEDEGLATEPFQNTDANTPSEKQLKPKPIGLGMVKLNKRKKTEAINVILKYQIGIDTAVTIDQAFKMAPHEQAFWATTAADHESAIDELVALGCEVKSFELTPGHLKMWAEFI